MKKFEITSGVTINFEYLPRREGDLAAFLENPSRAFEKMGWQSKEMQSKFVKILRAGTNSIQLVMGTSN